MYEQASAVADRARASTAPISTAGRCARTSAPIAAIDAGRFAEEIVPVEVDGPQGDDARRHRRGPAPRHVARGAGGAAAAGRRSTRRTPPATRRASTTARRRWSSPTRSGPRAARPDAARPHPRRRRDREPPRLARTRAGARRRGSRSSEAGLAVDDVDRFEINEAFASVALQSSRELGADPERVNVRRRRGRARPSGRRLGRAPADHAGPPARADGRRDRRRGDLLGRRPGRRDGARGLLRRMIDRILVVGAGQMGGGIAQVAADGRHARSRSSTSTSALERGLAAIRELARPPAREGQGRRSRRGARPHRDRRPSSRPAATAS